MQSPSELLLSRIGDILSLYKMLFKRAKLAFGDQRVENNQTYNIELPLAPAQVQMHMSNKHNLVLHIDNCALLFDSSNWS